MFRLVPLRVSLLHGADLAAERAGRLLVRVLKAILVTKLQGGNAHSAAMTPALNRPHPHSAYFVATNSSA